MELYKHKDKKAKVTNGKVIDGAGAVTAPTVTERTLMPEGNFKQ